MKEFQNSLLLNLLVSEPLLSTLPPFKQMGLKIIDACTPKRQQFSDQQIVLLWKFVSVKSISPFMGGLNVPDYVQEFIAAMKQFVLKSLDEPNRIERFAHYLHIGDHANIIKYIKRHPLENGIGWMYVAYMLVLQKSQGHLEKQ